MVSAPAAAHSDSIHLEQLTWPELQQRIARGATTVIVPTGGTEQNGPHMPLGKHNLVVAEAAGRIARTLGNTLVAPVLKIVPEGPMDTPTGNSKFPGTLGLSEDTFQRVLRDTSASLVRAGFTTICFIGDHGESQAAQEHMAQQLTKALQPFGIRVINVSAYYAPDIEERELIRSGLPAESLGDHGGVADTAQLMAVNPQSVRMDLLDLKKWKEEIPSGATGQPERATAEIGERLLRLRVENAVAQIRGALKPGAGEATAAKP
jgi:creatinine amidohydrolase/Fe(II)-dependent formamide hydrolase-like protein